MIDIKFIEENREKVEKAASDRGFEIDIDDLLSKHSRLLSYKKSIEEVNHQRKIAQQKRDYDEGKELKNKLKELEERLKQVERDFEEVLYQVPNVPLENVPEGDQSNNEILRKVGTLPKFGFTPKDHIELGEKLGLIDILHASKVSGTRFAYLKNQAVILEFALVQFAFEKLLKHGFTPVIPPAIIKKGITDSLGYWHGRIDKAHTANENYYLVYDPKEEEPGEKPEMYLIGTGEHAIVPMHKEEIFEEEDLPRKYVAFSPCFRREAGTYGKDTRGIFRVHQFDKVEMVSFVKPEDDETERKKLLNYAEDLMKSLKLPYQVVKLASGDLGFPAAETIDIETWMPSQGKYRETHSISTTTDFQARRLNIKYRVNGKTEYVSILNATAFAIGRTIIAIMENFQQKDGSILVPKVLQKYTGFAKIPA